MIFWASLLIGLSAGHPLWRAYRTNRHSTLRLSVIWAIGAWTVWLLTLIASHWSDWADTALGIYLSLAMTGCAGLAVLGARRPGAQAWNFVLYGLLAVLLLPITHGEGWLRLLQTPQILFLSAVLLMSFLNYLPTRFGLTALLVSSTCALGLIGLMQSDWHLALRVWGVPLAVCVLGIGLWIGCLTWNPSGSHTFDSTWRSFRDRFGALWALRLREQFNLSAKHAQLGVELRWSGLIQSDGSSATETAEASKRLDALLTRFREEPSSATSASGANQSTS